MNNEQLIHKFIENVWSKHQASALKDYFHLQAIFHNTQGENLRINDIERFLQEIFQAFPDIQYDVQDIISKDNKVFVRWIWNGTNTGKFQGHAPTNKKIHYHGFSCFHIEKNKIQEAWISAEAFGILRQLNLLPTVDSQI